MASLKKIGKKYYIQYYSKGKKQKREPTGTESLQVAKELLRQFESAQARGVANPLPTRTPLAEVVGKYVKHLYTVKRDGNAQKIVSYLRAIFGPICPGLAVKNQKMSAKAVKRKARSEIPVIEAVHFEDISTSDIASYIGNVVRSKGIKGKTANRYREILCRLYNWAMTQAGVRMPGGINPAAKVERYAEVAPVIIYLTIEEINELLDALSDDPQMQVMAATYIYAGLRREEGVWLTCADVDLTAGKHGIIWVRSKEVKGDNWKPKTGENRLVPVSITLRTYLERHVPRKSDGGWYFPSPEGSRWNPDNFSKALKRAIERAEKKVREKRKDAQLNWSCDEFRHTFGSQLAMAGESLYKISRLHGAGWKRDPLGPPFCSNFVWGQRFYQPNGVPESAGQHGRNRTHPQGCQAVSSSK